MPKRRVKKKTYTLTFDGAEAGEVAQVICCTDGDMCEAFSALSDYLESLPQTLQTIEDFDCKLFRASQIKPGDLYVLIKL